MSAQNGLGFIDTMLFLEGSKSAKEFISKLKFDSEVLPPSDKVKADRYLSAAERFLTKSSKFIDAVYKSRNLLLYNLLVKFVQYYPKSKQNLADANHLISSVVHYYTNILKTKPAKTSKVNTQIKFIKDNPVGIYDTIVVITNVIRTYELLVSYANLNK